MRTIFCSLDTLRADHVSCIDPSLGLTPNLDRLASEGSVFTQVVATDIPTQPSHTAVFTGRWGVNSGIVSHFHPPAQLDETIPWLPSMLQASGRPTGAVDHLFAMKGWFIRGYEDYMAPPGRSRSPASVVNEIAFPWISAHADDDFFLFLHYWDAHIPYVPPAPFKDRYTARSVGWRDPHVQAKVIGHPSYATARRNLYDHLDAFPNLEYVSDLYKAEVAYLDHEIGRLVSHLSGLGILDDTLLVIFGDHGEVMLEHPAWFDHAGLYDSVVRVPLIIRYPPGVPRSKVDAAVELVDVMPTVLDLVGLAHPEGLDGFSLLPLARGEITSLRSVSMLSECTWQAKRGLRTDRWKYIRSYDTGVYGGPEHELFDLARDPNEQANVAARWPGLVHQMETELHQRVSRLLAGRPDPMEEVIATGMPAIARLETFKREDEANAAKLSSSRGDHDQARLVS